MMMGDFGNGFGMVHVASHLKRKQLAADENGQVPADHQ
jgi:hypothetical protein